MVSFGEKELGKGERTSLAAVDATLRLHRIGKMRKGKSKKGMLRFQVVRARKARADKVLGRVGDIFVKTGWIRGGESSPKR